MAPNSLAPVALQELEVGSYERRIPSPDPPTVVALLQDLSETVQVLGPSAMPVVLGNDVRGRVERIESVGMGAHERHDAACSVKLHSRSYVDQYDGSPQIGRRHQMRSQHRHAAQGCANDSWRAAIAGISANRQQVGCKSVEIVSTIGVPLAVAVTAGVVSDDGIPARV